MSGDAPPVTRAAIIAGLEEACRAEEWLDAAWEGGSAAFGHDDALSDVDWVLVTARDRVEDAFRLVESRLTAMSPIEARWRLPDPTWHGHAQAFYRLRDAAADHFVDLVVMAPDGGDLFLAPERHGRPRVVFDRTGVSAPVPLDPGDLERENDGRRESIAVRHALLGVLPGKELRRGRPVDALGFYQSLTLRHLVELLRIVHDPARAAFGLRYLDRDLPADVRARLEPLLFVGSADDLAGALPAADTWIDELLEDR